jgi:hypothetical protein
VGPHEISHALVADRGRVAAELLTSLLLRCAQFMNKLLLRAWTLTTVLLLTIAPPPDRRMAGISCFMESNTPRMLTPHMVVLNRLLGCQQAESALDASVIERDVQPTEGCDGLFDECDDVIFPDNVGLHK